MGKESSETEHKRKGKPYEDGELEVILSLAPTKENIKWLSKLLGRSKNSIRIVYMIAFGHGPFGKEAGVQEQKITEAKRRVGIDIGRQKSRGEMEG